MKLNKCLQGNENESERNTKHKKHYVNNTELPQLWRHQRHTTQTIMAVSTLCHQHVASNKMKATQNTAPVTQTHNHVATYVAL
jgi:hypothetical protein